MTICEIEVTHARRRALLSSATPQPLPPAGFRPVSALAQFVVGAVGAAAALSAGIVVFGPVADADVLELAVRFEARAAPAPVVQAAGHDSVRVR